MTIKEIVESKVRDGVDRAGWYVIDDRDQIVAHFYNREDAAEWSVMVDPEFHKPAKTGK